LDCVIISFFTHLSGEEPDYGAMQIVGYSACPSDSHQRIRSISDCVLKSKGGDSVVRELLEDVMGVDLYEVLYGV